MDNKIDLGYLSTAAWTINTFGEQERTNCVNTQLDSWTEAKKRYYEIQKRKYNFSDFKYIIEKLVESLTDLFGINYKSKGKTPFLIELIRDCYPKSMKWDLANENPELYKKFEKLNNIFNDKVKHYDESKAFDLQKLNMEDIKDFMETTKLIWIWFINHTREGNPVSELLYEFNDSF